jgi:hypothetical protein
MNILKSVFVSIYMMAAIAITVFAARSLLASWGYLQGVSPAAPILALVAWIGYLAYAFWYSSFGRQASGQLRVGKMLPEPSELITPTGCRWGCKCWAMTATLSCRRSSSRMRVGEFCGHTKQTTIEYVPSLMSIFPYCARMESLQHPACEVFH